jgi:hypothetical protein
MEHQHSQTAKDVLAVILALLIVLMGLGAIANFCFPATKSKAQWQPAQPYAPAQPARTYQSGFDEGKEVGALEANRAIEDTLHLTGSCLLLFANEGKQWTIATIPGNLGNPLAVCQGIAAKENMTGIGVHSCVCSSN